MSLQKFVAFFNLEEEISKIGEKLVPSWLALVVQLTAMLVLFLVVFFIAYKPVKKMLKKRSDFIEQEVNDAIANKAKSESNIVQSEETLLASKKQASEIIELAKQQALKNKEQILEEANQEVNKMKLDAAKDIERSKQEALDDIHNEMVDVAIEASKSILKREVNEKDDKRLVEDFIKELE